MNAILCLRGQPQHSDRGLDASFDLRHYDLASALWLPGVNDGQVTVWEIGVIPEQKDGNPLPYTLRRGYLAVTWALAA